MRLYTLHKVAPDSVFNYISVNPKNDDIVDFEDNFRSLSFNLDEWVAPDLDALSPNKPLSNFVNSNGSVILIDERTHHLLAPHLGHSLFIAVPFRQEHLYFVRPPIIKIEDLCTHDSIVSFSNSIDGSDTILFTLGEFLELQKQDPEKWAGADVYLHDVNIKGDVLRKNLLFYRRLGNQAGRYVFATEIFKSLVEEHRLTGLSFDLLGFDYKVDGKAPPVVSFQPFSSRPFQFPHFQQPDLLPRIPTPTPSLFYWAYNKSDIDLMSDFWASGLRFDDVLLKDAVLLHDLEMAELLVKVSPRGLGGLAHQLASFLEYEYYSVCEWSDLAKEKGLEYSPLIPVLVENGAVMNAVVPDSERTALDYASDWNDPDLMAYLKSFGALSFRELSNEHITWSNPLMAAVCQRDPQFLTRVLEDISIHSLNIVHIQAALNELLRQAEQDMSWWQDARLPLLLSPLLKAGADPNILDGGNIELSDHLGKFIFSGSPEFAIYPMCLDRRALHDCVLRRQFRNLQLRLACGADVNLMDHHGQTTLDVALNNDIPEIVEFLQSVGARRAQEIPEPERRYTLNSWSASFRQPELLDTLLAQSPMSSSERDLFIAYHMMHHGLNAELIADLTRWGWKVPANTCYNGPSWLHLAVYRQYMCTRELYQAKVSPNPDEIPLLLAHGADPHQRDALGRTPLDLAKAYGVEIAIAQLQG